MYSKETAMGKRVIKMFKSSLSEVGAQFRVNQLVYSSASSPELLLTEDQSSQQTASKIHSSLSCAIPGNILSAKVPTLNHIRKTKWLGTRTAKQSGPSGPLGRLIIYFHLNWNNSIILWQFVPFTGLYNIWLDDRELFNS